MNQHTRSFLNHYLLILALLVFLWMPCQLRSAHASTSIFINEIHYDNNGSDTDEAVEIAGPAGSDLTGWHLVAYNGGNGTAYDTVALSDSLPDQCNGSGTLTYSIAGLQNGAPDGIALVDPTNTVVQFLSYEGSFPATAGPADGLTSADIGVAEDGNTPAGYSLQLSGSGTTYADFHWNAPAPATFGDCNTGQTFASLAGAIVVSGNGAAIVSGDTTPDAADHTDFGSVDIPNATVTHTFIISNTGNADLLLTDTPPVTIAGPGGDHFSITQQPDTPVAPGGSTTFAVTFDPTAAGLHTATLSIAHNDPDESSYTFSIQGTGTPAAATITLSDLVHSYDGTPKQATVTTDPADLAVTITYNGAPDAPTAAGDYTVVATIDDPAFQGSATATLTINPATPQLSISNPRPRRTGCASGQSVIAYTLNNLTVGHTYHFDITVYAGTEYYMALDFNATLRRELTTPFHVVIMRRDDKGYGLADYDMLPEPVTVEFSLEDLDVPDSASYDVQRLQYTCSNGGIVQE